MRENRQSSARRLGRPALSSTERVNLELVKRVWEFLGCADGQVVASATWEKCPKVGDRLGNAGTKIGGVSLRRRTAG